MSSSLSSPPQNSESQPEPASSSASLARAVVRRRVPRPHKPPLRVPAYLRVPKRPPAVDCEIYKSTTDYSLFYKLPRNPPKGTDPTAGPTATAAADATARVASINVVLEALQAFRPLMEPLATYLKVGCGYLWNGIWTEASNTYPTRWSWLLRQPLSAFPKYLDYYPYPYNEPDDPSCLHITRKGAPALTRPVIRKWLNHALDQACPSYTGDTGYGDDGPRNYPCHTYWNEIRVEVARVRIVTPSWQERKVLRVRYKHITEIPTERRLDGLWVAGPTPDLGTKSSPIQLRFGGEPGMDGVSLDVSVPWWRWKWSDTPEGAALVAILETLVLAGWQFAPHSALTLKTNRMYEI